MKAPWPCCSFRTLLSAVKSCWRAKATMRLASGGINPQIISRCFWSMSAAVKQVPVCVCVCVSVRIIGETEDMLAHLEERHSRHSRQSRHSRHSRRYALTHPHPERGAFESEGVREGKEFVFTVQKRIYYTKKKY